VGASLHQLIGRIPNLVPVRRRDQGLKPFRDVMARVAMGKPS
jgi:hypothetical protein